LTIGHITFSAENATIDEARLLEIEIGEVIFVIDRTTWVADQSITSAHLCYSPSFSLSSTIWCVMPALAEEHTASELGLKSDLLDDGARLSIAYYDFGRLTFKT
jgi:hypothetical protein